MRLLILLVVSIATTGCAAPRARLGEEIVAIAQVCFPVRPPQAPSVSFVANGSARGGSEELKLETTSGQGLFMTYGHAPDIGRALLVSTDTVTNFVFSVPRKPGGDEGWGPWQSPNFETQEALVAVHMAQGRAPSSQSSPGPQAPNVRYRLMRFEDYLRYKKEVSSERIPQCGAQQGAQADGLALREPAA